MSRTTERVSRDLGQIADQATPSSSAWDSIRTKIDAQTDEPDVAVVRLDTQDKEVRTRPWLAVAAVAAAVVSLAVAVGVVVMSGDEDSTSEIATEAPPAEQENESASASEAAEPPVVYPKGGADGDLAGTRWRVYEYFSDGEITRTLRDSTIILHFGHDGTVSGFGGCNDYQARYDVTGDYQTTEATEGFDGIDPLEGQAIQFSGLTSSDTVCASAELMEQEAQYFQALLDVGLWRIDFDVELIMRVADGGPHRLSARPQPPAEEVESEAAPSDVESAAQFLDDLHGLDTEATRAVMEADAIVSYLFVGGTDDIPGLQGILEATGWEFTAENCAEIAGRGAAAADESTTKVACDVTFEDAVSKAASLEPYPGSVVEVWIEDGAVTLLLLDFEWRRHQPEVASPFRAWLSETHPEDVRTMTGGGDDHAVTPESIALWEEYTAEYIAEKYG